MKKLLITTMAAVSVGLCAKAADDGFISGTSFETVPEKSYLATNGETTLCNWYGEAGSVLSDDYSTDPELRGRYWMTEATDAQLVVSNVTNFAGDYLSTDNRPQQWRDGDNTKALYIDTDKPLMRYVHPSTDGETAGGADLNQDEDIFFDSVVQFTATDVAAEPDSADKLRVWLYTSPDDVSETNLGLFKETSRKTCLVVTAGKYDGDLSTSNLKVEHYEVQIEGVELQPDTWHRLTIKAIADIDSRADFYTPAFEIWVDGKPVTYGEGEDKKTQFPSLKRGVVNETLQCVAFDGKGAVDDIVFTTTVPEFAKKPEAATANVTITFSNFEAIDGEYGVWYDVNDKSFDILEASTKLELNVGDKISVCFGLLPDYELDSSMNATKHEDGYYVITIDALTAEGATIAIEIKKAGGSGGVTVGGTSVVIGDDGTIANITTAFDGKAVSGELDTTKFKSYYTAEVKDGILSIKLDQKAAAPFADATEDKEVLEVGEDDSGNPELTVRIKPYVGLYYGAMTGSALDNLTLTSEYQKATTDEVIEFTATGKAGDTAGFIKVVVTDIPPEE